ncbi:MAG TPA: Do family serine endopeptidase [Myxococcota bacterium]|nr:Do family serine endopeptidase [Myxococcota bacterium]
MGGTGATRGLLRLALGIAAGAALGAALAWGIVRTRSEALGAPLADPLGAPHSSFALLAERAGAGVVFVRTSKTAPLGMPLGGRSGIGGRDVSSIGTGFVISDDGIIVTNNHVVDGVDWIRVVLSDGSEHEAEIVGQDPKTDIALLRVAPSERLHPLPLGDSDAILPGDWVVAIGNPFGLDHTVTVGIVSAKGRDIGHGPYDDYIQTDAAMNPGNSGGPLLNLRGEVVGINSAINPEANTIGFAVPINLARQILPELLEKGRVTRGWLGVGVQELTPEIAKKLELDGTHGALVSQVREDSPAAKAGIERGDVLVGYRGDEITDLRALPRAVSDTSVGAKVPIDLIRDGRRVSVEVQLAELPEEPVAPAPVRRAAGVERYGLQVRPLSPELGERLGVAEPGLVVTGVEREMAADRAGLEPGDVLLEADRRPVAGIADLAVVLEGAQEGTLLLVQRGEATFYTMLARPRS